MEKRKRVLILGDLESTYIRGFITRFLVPCGYIVDIKTVLDTKERKEKCEKIAKELGVKIIEKNELNITKQLTRWQRIKILKPLATSLKGALYSYYKFRSKFCGEYDFVHVHYLYYEVLRNAWRYKTSTNKIIASWWGSDLFRKGNAELEKCWKYIKNFDLVTTDSIDLEKEYFERIVRNREHSSTYKRLYLGSEVADSIDLQRNNAKRIIQEKIIGDDKVIIAIGYNAHKAQQHLQVIEALGKLDVEKKNRIIILLQMTYAVVDEAYPDLVAKRAEELGFSVIRFDKFLSNEEVANIRICTDIFINAQTTDAFCSTIKEYMYARTYLVNAKWLEYEELKEWGLKTRVFESFAEIPGIVEDVLCSNDEYLLDTNQRIIGEKFCWDGCAEKWNKVYEGLV